jgi:hypothetical protein
MRGILATFLVVLLFCGCDLKREPDNKERVVLRKGARVPPSVDGWVAVPLREPTIERTAGQEKTARARLLVDQVVPPAMAGWIAMPEKVYSAMTGVKLEAQKGEVVERWAMRINRRVPEEKDGWAGVPGTQPEIARHKERHNVAFARLGANHLIPQEMDGWVAVSVENFEAMVKAYEMREVRMEKTGVKAEEPEEKASPQGSGEKKNSEASASKSTAPILSPLIQPE